MIEKTELYRQIKESFGKLGFSVRGNQDDICYSVLDAFLNENKRNVVLNAGTGVGKSIIGAVISDVIHHYTSKNASLPAVICMGTNGLSKQYSDSFEKLGKYKYFRIMGASNYSCAFMESQLSAMSKTADDCVKSKLLPAEVEKYCTRCEYDAARKIVNSTENLITNYTYFMISSLASNHLKPRKLHIMDEAHTINDWFCSYSEIIVSVALFDKYIKEIDDTNGKCVDAIAALIILKEKLSSAEINDRNYIKFLELLHKIYIDIGDILSLQSIGLKNIDVIKSIKFEKMSKKYISLASKISDLFDNEYDHVFDDSIPNVFTVKIIFVGKMMEKLLTDYNLFMSATITESYAFDILELDKNATEFVMVDPVFPPENKPIFFLGKNYLNYTSLQDSDVIDTLKHQIKFIVDHHKGQKGLILSPSFFLGSSLVYGLKGCIVFEHKSGMNISDLVSDFKNYSGAAVLVSPSIWEGFDFIDDKSRFQVIVKSPYPSLAEKRVKYIANKYPHIYQEMTMLKILQGIGRSVRTPTDFAATYMLDPSTKKIYNSQSNIWKNHYDVQN